MRETGGVAYDGEVERIEQALRTEGWTDRAGLRRALRNWARLAAEVSRYTGAVDDYTNDLTQRDYLDKVWLRASNDLREEIESETAGPDEVFRGSTADDAEHRLGSYFKIDTDDGWWWHRTPSSGPLAEYLAKSD
jgi:hypothetical protein